MNSYNEVRQAIDPAVGVPFKELAPLLGIPLPTDPRKRKAAGGDVSESLLDIARNSIPHADLVQLGTEVKSIPLNTLSRPRESTKLQAFNLTTVKGEPDFYRSILFDKLRAILFIPIMKADNRKPDFWYIRPPFLWLATKEQLSTIETDYNTLRQAAIQSKWSDLSGRVGRYLTIKISDDTSRGKPEPKKRRAWWLKPGLTRAICEQSLWPKRAIQQRQAEQKFLREAGFSFESD